jgi:hypothetical protein
MNTPPESELSLNRLPVYRLRRGDLGEAALWTAEGQDTAQAPVLDTEHGRLVPSNSIIFAALRNSTLSWRFAVELFLIVFV